MRAARIAKLRKIEKSFLPQPWVSSGFVFPKHSVAELLSEPRASEWSKLEEEIGEPRASKRVKCFFYVRWSALFAMMRGLPRLLDEREALLQALKPIVERLDGDREFVIPDGGAEMLHAAREAIAKAEAP